MKEACLFIAADLSTKPLVLQKFKLHPLFISFLVSKSFSTIFIVLTYTVLAYFQSPLYKGSMIINTK